MQPKEALQELRDAARQAMAADTSLSRIWRDLPVAEVAEVCTSADAAWLRELMIRRIDPVNAFELLAHIDLNAAIEALLDRHLGEGVDPDRKFGGYSSELSIMLDDLVEIAGPDALRQLLRREGFGRKHLKDRRVIEAFSEALDIDEKQWETWLNSNLPEKVSAKAS